MGQVTIYLEDELEAQMVAEAKAQNLSKSKWIAEVIREKLVNEWPPAVREAAGSWCTFPDPEEIEIHNAADIEREQL